MTDKEGPAGRMNCYSSSRQLKKKKYFLSSSERGWSFLCSYQVLGVLFHWGEHSQSALVAFVVVIVDVFGDHLNHLLATGKFMLVVTFSFQNPPESFHWAIVDAFTDSGHALDHPMIKKLLMEHIACVLESPITVK